MQTAQETTLAPAKDREALLDRDAGVATIVLAVVAAACGATLMFGPRPFPYIGAFVVGATGLAACFILMRLPGSSRLWKGLKNLQRYPSGL
mgnify:CR=1 FL=1